MDLMNRDLTSETIEQASSWMGVFLLGVAIGTVIGLLTAPRSGRETLKALTGGVDELGEKKMERARSKMSNAGREVIERAPHDIGGPRIPNTRLDAP
jgi:gas vesicle protein